MKASYIAWAIPAFFTFIIVELIIARRQGKATYYRFNDAITDLGCGIGQQIVNLLKKGFLFAGYYYVYEHYRLCNFSNWQMWLVALVGVDFCYYWWHRLSHEMNLLWAIHVVHHQSEDYNLAVALRQAWFSGVSNWPFYMPLILLGVSPPVFIISESISVLYQFWIHTRLIGKLGPLEWFINTPSHHRVHHARNIKYLDKNYGAILIIWDRLFGTFKEEEEEPLYGTVSPYTSWNPIWANFQYWGELFKSCRQAERWLDKLQIWFMPPGWQPNSHNVKLSEDANPIRFKTKTPSGLNRYIAVQFTLISLGVTMLLFKEDSLSYQEIFLAGGFVIFTTLIWGGLLEQHAWAWALEIVRLGMIAIVGSLYLGAKAMSYQGLIIYLAIFICLGWLWPYRQLESMKVSSVKL